MVAANRDAELVRARWWLAVPVALFCLAFVDVLLGLWRPHPVRLPEQFSAAYLKRYVDEQRGNRPVVFLGDSVFWGYKFPARDAVPSRIMRDFPRVPMTNLSYEGGSSVNSYFMLRYVLSRGVRPRLVVFNVNSKETNTADSAYRRLHPSLEILVAPMFTSHDRHTLDLQQPLTFAQRLVSFVERYWRLYRYRVDLREAFFGTDDAATALKNFSQKLTGSAHLQALAHRPTPDRFLGTYDLGPLSAGNVDFTYLRKLSDLLHAANIPAIAILTPTNHRLLHDYIDVPEYDARLNRMRIALEASGVRVINDDRMISSRDFLDNDHLTPAGDRKFARILSPVLRKALAK